MGLFGSFRKMLSYQNELQDYWNVPESEGEVDAILEPSKSGQPQVIYKHSYRCSISLFAKSSLDSGIEDLLTESGAKAHLIDVVGMRAISNYIANKIDVQHQSPQIILLHNGFPFWTASHGNARLEALQDAVHELKNPV